MNRDLPPWADGDLALLGLVATGLANVAVMLWQAYSQWRASRQDGVPEDERYIARAWLALMSGIGAWIVGLMFASVWVTFLLGGRPGVLRWGLVVGVVGIIGALWLVRYFRYRSDRANTRSKKGRQGG